MARKPTGRTKPASRRDPDLLRRLFAVHEELTVLCFSWQQEPVGAAVSWYWIDDLHRQLFTVAEAVAAMTRSGQIDQEALRAVYDGMVAVKGGAQGQVKWGGDDALGKQLGARREDFERWRADIEAQLDRIIAGLRELVIEVGQKGAE